MYQWNPSQNRLTLAVHVQPGAKKPGVVGLHGDALKIRIAAQPTDGKANAALIDFLRQWFNLPASAITIKHGLSSRHKAVEIHSQDAGIFDSIVAALDTIKNNARSI